MAGSYIGFDIGNMNIKYAERSSSGVVTGECRMPENIVEADKVIAPATLGSFLRGAKRERHMHATKAALVLSETRSLFRHVSLPMMSTAELELNLPHEFRDFIEGDPASYFYDYVVDSSNMPDDDSGHLELFAAAVPKATIEKYTDVLRRGGFKLKLAIPAPMAYMRLLRHHIADHPEAAEREYVFMNIGHDDTTFTLVRGYRYLTSRTIDLGGADFDVAIADHLGVDTYLASGYKFNNFEGVMDSPACAEICQRFCIEVNKVINFYNFNNPEAEVDGLLYLGGGAEIPQLTAALSESVDVPCDSIRKIMPAEVENVDGIGVCALALAGMLDAEEVL